MHNYAQVDVIALIEPIRDANVDFHWSIKSLFDDILYFVKYFNNVKFSFFCREGNVSVHLLAQWAALVNWTGPVSISYLPSSILWAWDRDGIWPHSFVSPLVRVEQ